MADSLPVFYLIILIALLGGATWVVLRQVLKTRQTEMALARLQRQLNQEKGTAAEYFELGSILLGKKLYTQAIARFKEALKSKDLESGDPMALVHNALGYAYAAQEQYDLAIRSYKESLKQCPDYVTALNNLAFAYERKQLTVQALEIYEQVLTIEPSDRTAKRRAESLKRLVLPST